jgi:hypothetical protein
LFIYDPVTYRTYDDERNCELSNFSGGSDGTVRFDLVCSESVINLWMRSVYEKHVVEDTCGTNEPRYSSVTTWTVGGCPLEFADIVREAILAQEYGMINDARIHGITEEVRRSFEGSVVKVEIMQEALGE